MIVGVIQVNVKQKSSSFECSFVGGCVDNRNLWYNKGTEK